MTRDFSSPMPPKPVVLEETGSTQDEAFAFVSKGCLPFWGSILAKKQNSGRGQMRRHWVSMAGNLMVSLRLPEEEPFSGQAGALATGVLVCSALRKMSFPVFIKWPNDLLIETRGEFRKAGGILLEERNSCLLAGMGLNLANAPQCSQLDEDTALKPGFLFEENKKKCQPEIFWQVLLQEIFDIYINMSSFHQSWHTILNRFLAWKDRKVVCVDGQSEICGVLKYVDSDGSLLIDTDSESRKIFSGVLRPV